MYLEMQFNYEALNKLGSYMEFEELRTMIDTAINTLPGDLRETFLLSRFDELPYKENCRKAIHQHQNCGGPYDQSIENSTPRTKGLPATYLPDYQYIFLISPSLLGNIAPME